MHLPRFEILSSASGRGGGGEQRADSFITEGQVEEEVAHGLVGVPYHLAVVATRLSKAQRMMWDKTTTKTSALTSSDRSGPLEALSPALPPARPEETMVFALGSRVVVR